MRRKETKLMECNHANTRGDSSQALRASIDSNPLLWLFRHKDKTGKAYIGAAAFAAGERLRSDIALAQLAQNVTMSWSKTQHVDKSRGASNLNPTEAMSAARQRVNNAMTFVGAEFSGILIDLCGFDKGLETIETERQWPARSAKLVLRLALDCLARHYGLSDVAYGQNTGRVTAFRAQN